MASTAPTSAMWQCIRVIRAQASVETSSPGWSHVSSGHRKVILYAVAGKEPFLSEARFQAHGNGDGNIQESDAGVRAGPAQRKLIRLAAMHRQKVILFDLGGVLIGVTGRITLRALLPHLSDHDVLERWVESPAVNRFERGQMDARQFAGEFIEEWQLRLSQADFIDSFGELGHRVLRWRESDDPGAAHPPSGGVPQQYQRDSLGASGGCSRPVRRLLRLAPDGFS